LENDADVSNYATYITNKYEFIDSEGLRESLVIESGDFTAFPLDYLHVNEPVNDNDLALSYLNADELGKKVGDDMELIINGQIENMHISVIYQDVTNGGRTAKARLPVDQNEALRYEWSVNVNGNKQRK